MYMYIHTYIVHTYIHVHTHRYTYRHDHYQLTPPPRGSSWPTTTGTTGFRTRVNAIVSLCIITIEIPI